MLSVIIIRFKNFAANIFKKKKKLNVRKLGYFEKDLLFRCIERSLYYEGKIYELHSEEKSLKRKWNL